MLPVTLRSLVVWAACLTASEVMGGPAVDLATVLVVLPGAVAAACAAHGLSSAEGLPTTAPTAAALQGLAAAAAVLAVGGPVRFATAGTGEGTVTASLAHLPLHAAIAMAVLMVVATRRGRPVGRGSRQGRRVVTAALAAVLAASVAGPGVQTAAAAAPVLDAPKTCVAGQEQRSYAVAAATVDVPFNRWGAMLRSARIFVLQQDLHATRNWWRPLAASPSSTPRTTAACGHGPWSCAPTRASA